MRKCRLIIVLSLLFFQCRGQMPREVNYDSRREIMVRTQIESRGITDPKVINAMRVVERHLFVPESLRESAYGDYPLPIGYGQTISQPFIVAFMTQVLDLEKDDKVLEIGTGSGYQAAILAEICDSVYTVEIIPELGKQAGLLFNELDYDNIIAKTGDGYLGWPEHAPFDAVIVTAAPSHVPSPLVDQLKEGGKMVIPVGEQGVQSLYLLEKESGKLVQRNILDVLFVPLVDKEKKNY